MIRFALVLAGAPLLLMLAACAGDGGPSIRVLLEADLGELSDEAQRDAARDRLLDFLERRAIIFGATDVNVQLEGADRFTVTMNAITSPEGASRLLEGDPALDLRKPLLNDVQEIVCQAADGSDFPIRPEQVVYGPKEPGGRVVPRCTDADARIGDIRWVSAISGEAETDPFALILIQPSEASVDRTGAPAVVMRFTRDAAAIIEGATGRIVGLPLGIFIDDELIAGPTIAVAIATGTLVISDLSLPEADILAAQINSGRLPVPIHVISAEEIP